MDLQPLLQQFRSLGTEEKLELLGQLWDELAADPDAIPLSEEHRRILDERLRQHEQSPEDVVDWEDVKVEALRRIRAREG